MRIFSYSNSSENKKIHAYSVKDFSFPTYDAPLKILKLVQPTNTTESTTTFNNGCNSTTCLGNALASLQNVTPCGDREANHYYQTIASADVCADSPRHHTQFDAYANCSPSSDCVVSLQHNSQLDTHVACSTHPTCPQANHLIETLSDLSYSSKSCNNNEDCSDKFFNVFPYINKNQGVDLFLRAKQKRTDQGFTMITRNRLKNEPSLKSQMIILTTTRGHICELKTYRAALKIPD